MLAIRMGDAETDVALGMAAKAYAAAAEVGDGVLV